MSTKLSWSGGAKVADLLDAHTAFRRTFKKLTHFALETLACDSFNVTAGSGSFDDETTVFKSAHVLRLLRSCPLISELDWLENGHLSAIVDGDNVDAINKLLKSRGGYEVDVLEHYGPVREGH